MRREPDFVYLKGQSIAVDLTEAAGFRQWGIKTPSFSSTPTTSSSARKRTTLSNRDRLMPKSTLRTECVPGRAFRDQGRPGGNRDTMLVEYCTQEHGTGPARDSPAGGLTEIRRLQGQSDQQRQQSTKVRLTVTLTLRLSVK